MDQVDLNVSVRGVCQERHCRGDHATGSNENGLGLYPQMVRRCGNIGSVYPNNCMVYRWVCRRESSVHARRLRDSHASCIPVTWKQGSNTKAARSNKWALTLIMEGKRYAYGDKARYARYAIWRQSRGFYLPRSSGNSSS